MEKDTLLQENQNIGYQVEMAILCSWVIKQILAMINKIVCVTISEHKGEGN